MFCRNCGKPTPDGIMLCDECLATQQGQQPQNEPFAELNEKPMQQPEAQPFAQQPFTQPYGQPYGQQPYPPTFQQAPMQEGNRKEGFGKALTATILASVGFILAYIGLLVAAMTIEFITEEPSGYYDPATTAAAYTLSMIGIVFTLIGIALGIVGIILGASSIKTFNAARKANRIKPVATLVLGIVGLATGVFAIIIGGVSMLFCLALFAL